MKKLRIVSGLPRSSLSRPVASQRDPRALLVSLSMALLDLFFVPEGIGCLPQT